jgi:hypothetical protein
MGVDQRVYTTLWPSKKGKGDKADIEASKNMRKE